MSTKEFDAAIELQLDLARLSASSITKALRILRTLEKELLAEIKTGKYTTWRRERINAQIKALQRAISDYLASTAAVADDAARAVAAPVARSVALSIGEAALPATAVLEAITGKLLVQGTPSKDWWANLSQQASFRVAQQIRQGVVSSETNAQIIRRVRQVLTTTRANAAGMVQTTIAQIANDTRMATYLKNIDIIKVFRAVATLDTHTCPVCGPLDGKEWTPDHKPFGNHKYPFPSYPFHPFCRCFLMARITTDAPGGKRASGDGPVDASLTFEGWLARQSKEKVEASLGKGRARLYLAGKLTLGDLVNGAGNELSLKELLRKYN